MGYLVLQGGSEFSGAMNISDLRAIELAGGPDAPMCIVPAAAAPDHNHHRAGQNGCAWFKSLGARDVLVLPLVDRATADDPQNAAWLRRSKLIYLLGGFPAYLAGVLQGSAAWQAARAAWDQGAVVAGSSAGAMVLCEFLYDPSRQQIMQGLGVLANTCLIPHADTFGWQWISPLQKALPRATLIGIEECTGAINDGPHETWSVYGPGAVTLFRCHGHEEYRAGMRFEL